MHRSASSFVVVVIATSASIAAAAAAAPAPEVIATCGDSKIDVVAGSAGAAGELHAQIAGADGSRWSFAATISLARIDEKTRTITVENLHTPRDKEPTPSGMCIDVLLDSKKVILRHASEGPPDPAYAVDLEKCTFAAGGDAAIAGLVPPPTEPLGCTPVIVHGTYRAQVGQVAKLPEADADREAQALCEDHQKTIEARSRLEAVISDRAAHDRIAARGAALLHTEPATFAPARDPPQAALAWQDPRSCSSRRPHARRDGLPRN